MSFLERARSAMDDDDDNDSENAHQAGMVNEADEIEESQVARLIRAWTDERHSPDLLRFQGDLLDGLLQKIHEQVWWSFPTVLSLLGYLHSHLNLKKWLP